MTALNGHPVTPQPEEPALAVARGLYASQFEEGDTPWDDLDGATREDLVEYSRIAIAHHVAWLNAQGFRLLPPKTLLKPTTEDEAMGMVQLAKQFLDASRRKGKLMGQPGRKLILPPGSKLQ